MRRTLTALTITATLTAATLAACAVPPPNTPFGGGVINLWFPLNVGRHWTYTGVDEGRNVTEQVTVTAELKTIVTNGNTIQANVVVDQLFVPWLAESTRDFYATANDGTVYYLGEETAEYNSAGHVVSTAGSWQAGVNGAFGGVFMPPYPQVGETHQQENAPDAKDWFRVDSINGGTMVVSEWSELEPGVLEHKTYWHGTGLAIDGGLHVVV